MRHIIIGDVHGCFTQMIRLLNLVEVRDDDQLIFLGDLIDKGPDSPAVVRHVRILSEHRNVVLIQGNHEEKFFRFLKKLGEAPEHIQTLAGKSSDSDIEFLKSGVLFHRIDGDNLVVHGGILPEHELPEDPSKLSNKQRKNLEKLLRTRFIRGRDKIQREIRIYNGDGVRVQTIKIGENDLFPEIPAGCTHDVKENIKEKGGFIPWKQEEPDDVFWANEYDGRFGHVWFGHESFKPDVAPREFPHATGLDLGCVMGGSLAAAILESGKKVRYVVVEGLPPDQAVPDLGEE